MNELPDKIKSYVKAMQKASGLSEFDAITSVLFAITTHIDLEQYPILVYLGVAGSGKSSAMRQLFLMCRGSKWITGRTPASQRRELKGVRTAFIEEADKIETDLYILRYSNQTGLISVPEQTSFGTWGSGLQSYDIFGSTVMHRRVSIGDVGLRSRSIIIRTQYELGSYQHIIIGDVSAIASSVANKVKQRIKEIEGIDRVQQTWNPLCAIGEQLGIAGWGKKAMEVINKEAETLKGGQGYEPSEAILQAIDILSRDEVSGKRVDESIKISDVVRVVKDEFAVPLKPNQIKEEAEAKGFQTSLLRGYPVIKVKKDRLDALLPE